MKPASGFAVCDRDGTIDMRTVGPTEQSAMVNGLFCIAHMFVTANMTESAIANSFELALAGMGYSIRPVNVSLAVAS